MKRPLLFCFILFFISCTLSPTDRAKKTVGKNLDETLHDRKSYEPVKWGVLDSAYSNYFEDDKYKEYAKKTDDYLKETREAESNANIYSAYFSPAMHKLYVQESGDYLDSAKKYLKMEEDFKASFKSAFIGYKIEHSYRAKNLMGNLGIHHMEYYLNPTLDTVINFEDVSENKKTTEQ